MNIRKLRHVLVLAEHLTFSRACAEVHLSQSALSRSIQSIELELGVPLFDRSATKVSLTSYGKIFIARAKRIVFEANELLRDIALTQQEDGVGELSIGLGATAAALLRAPLLSHFTAKSPHIRITVKHGDSDDLLGLLLDDRIDLFVGDIAALAFRTDLDVRPLSRLPGGFFCRTGHPLLATPTVAPEALLQYPLGCTRLSPYALENLERRLGRSIAENIKLSSDDFAEMAGAARKSDIILFGCRPVFCAEIRDGELHELRVVPYPKGSAKFGIVSLAGRTQSPAALKAIALAEQTFRQYSVESETDEVTATKHQ
jgi:DNA-binding transcriptional LysR family regulator